MTQQHDREARFAHLLRPIRDLALTWGVDIASELERYLEELEDIKIELEDAPEKPPGVNFAEAAYLIQGSTLVYSKKVEHLYTLVFHAISAINSAREKQKDNARGKAGANHEGECDDPFKEEEYLLLDDEIPQAAPEEINLPRGSLGGPADVSNTLVEPPLVLLPQACQNVENGIQNDSALGVGRAIMHHSGALLVDGMKYDDSTVKGAELRPIYSESPNYENDDEPDFGGLAFDGGNSDEENTPIYNGDSQTQEQDQGGYTVNESKAKGTPYPRPVQSKSYRKDPFQMYDPHDQSGVTLKPFKQGRTSMKRKAQSGPKKRKRSNKNCSTTLDELFEQAFEVAPKRKGANFVRCPGLQNRFKAVYTARKAAFKKIRDRYSNMHHIDHVESDHFSDDGECDDDDHELAIDHDNDVGGESNFPEESSFDEQPLRNIYDTGGDEYDEGVGLDWQGEVTIQMMAARREERCRQYLAEMSKKWQQNLTQNRLVERVQTWTETILPVLEEEESHPPFDIHECGRSIVADFEERCKTRRTRQIPMSQVLFTQEKYQFCRKFLASLQLANAGVIRIIPASEDGDPVLELARDLETSLHVSNLPKDRVTFEKEVDVESVDDNETDGVLDKENIPNFANVILATPIKRSSRKRRRKSFLITPQSVKRKAQRLRLR